jgi:hypothetical protein
VTGRKDPSNQLPVGVRFIRNDAADPHCGEQLLEALPSGIGLDGLWLNAGYAQVPSIDEVDAAFFDQMMNSNARRPTLQLAALCSRLNDGASVLVTSSTATHEGSPMASIYAATKGARWFPFADAGPQCLQGECPCPWGDQHRIPRFHVGGVPREVRSRCRRKDRVATGRFTRRGCRRYCRRSRHGT